VNGEELEKFVPDLLQARYPGRAREVGEFGDSEPLSVRGWMLELDGCILTVRAAKTTHPFIWIRGGIAHAIPKSEALALQVAAGNKDLVVGRLYLAYGDDVTMVVFDETIFGGYLSLQYEPSIQDVVNRLETSIQYTNEWSAKIRDRFEGQPFTSDDSHLLTF
jgi:hypothetical protein